ncbi:MAG: 50S ribosomal protein L4 [Candidatus Nanopelagicales bacterium]
MASIDVLTPAGTTAGSVELPAEVFDVQVNVPVIHQVVVAQQAAARQGTHDTKSRGEVSGGGRKPYKQKGTGRARQGSTRAPQFTGGGVVHGPTPRTYEQRTPKKMKASALRGALSDRARGGRVHVISAVVDGDLPSTKGAAATLAALTGRRNALVVVERDDIVGWKSLRNLPGVHLLVADQLNTYDVLCSDDVVFTSGALEAFLSGPICTKAPRVAEGAAKAAPAARTAQAAAGFSQKAAEVKAEVTQRVAKVKAEVAEELTEAKAEVAEAAAGVAAKVVEVKAEVAEELTEAKAEVAEAAAGVAAKVVEAKAEVAEKTAEAKAQVAVRRRKAASDVADEAAAAEAAPATGSAAGDEEEEAAK